MYMELKTARITVLVDPAKKKAFEHLCARQDLSPSQAVRRLLRDYLAHHGVTFVPSGTDPEDDETHVAGPVVSQPSPARSKSHERE